MSEPDIRDIDWQRFETLNMLYRDYQQAVRDYAERKSWVNWLNLKLAKSTYESYARGK